MCVRLDVIIHVIFNVAGRPHLRPSALRAVSTAIEWIFPAFRDSRLWALSVSSQAASCSGEKFCTLPSKHAVRQAVFRLGSLRCRMTLNRECRTEKQTGHFPLSDTNWANKFRLACLTRSCWSNAFRLEKASPQTWHGNLFSDNSA